MTAIKSTAQIFRSKDHFRNQLSENLVFVFNNSLQVTLHYLSLFPRKSLNIIYRRIVAKIFNFSSGEESIFSNL